jgi:ribosomal protein S12 methylthiotransferase
VGFPGETEADFEQLLAFLEEVQFDRVGAFTYSPQEGTRAWAMADDVPEDVKQERLERLMELQRQVTAERYERHLGRVVRVLVNARGTGGAPAEGRAWWQADDIDGITTIRGEGVDTLAPGTIVDAEIEDVVDDYDFAARLVCVVDAPATVVRAGRRLPMMATTVGSFGR